MKKLIVAILIAAVLAPALFAAGGSEAATPAGSSASAAPTRGSEAAVPAGEGIKTRGKLPMATLKSVIETEGSFLLSAPSVDLEKFPDSSWVYTFMNTVKAITDTSPIPKNSALSKVLVPVDFAKLFYQEPATDRIIFALREASRTYTLTSVDRVSWQIGAMLIDRYDYYDASREFFATIASLRPLSIITISGNSLVASGVEAFKPPKGGQAYIPVWEGLSLDPPIYVVVFQGKDVAKVPIDTAPKSPIYIRRGYKIALVFPPDQDSLIAAIRPEALYRDGYSIVDGYGKDGFDRQGYDRESYDRYGWSAPSGSPNARTRSGDRWSGILSKGREGFGILTRSDGTRYIGEYHEDREEGTGVEFYQAGSPLIKKWSKGTLLQSKTPVGFIVSSLYKWVYLGEGASSGKAHGPGDAISSDGMYRIENGIFNNGMLVSGTLITANGTKYIGNFANEILVAGRIEGKDGSRYEGPLVGGLPEGKGRITTSDGTMYAGEFKSGAYNGQGTITRPGGEKYEGEFRDGKPHGMGIYFNGEIIERCEYYDGKRIDQAYLIKVENEKQLEAMRTERERMAKEKADQAEIARLASERAEAEKQAKAGKSSNNLMAGIFGVGAALMGSRVGLADAEAVLYGVSVAQDIAKGDASLSGSTATAQSIIDSRTGGSTASLGGTGTASAATTKEPKFRPLDNLLDKGVKDWRRYSGDAQIYPFFQQAQMYYVEYKNAVAQGYSEAECNKIYDLHRQATDYAMNVWKGFGLDKAP